MPLTRSDHRAKCIEAMARAMLPVASGKGAAFDPNGHSANLAKIAFDALHGIARVVPIEADGGMIEWMPIPSARQIWEAVSAAGDLTKRPETKP